MNKKFWLQQGWAWLLAAGWATWFSYDSYKTYTWHELTLVLPTAAVVAAAWLWLFRKGRLWVRLAVAAVAVALSATVGVFGASALRASRTFRHYPVDGVSKMELFCIEDAPQTKERIRYVNQFSLSDTADEHRERIRKIVGAFHTVRPCWRSASPANSRYLMLLTNRNSGGESRLILICDPLARPLTARVLIPWKEPFTGELMFSHYESVELFEELRRAGLR
jgi:hypothetical protein